MSVSVGGGNPAASSGERLNCVDEPGMTKGAMTDAEASGSLNRVDTTLRLKQLRAAMSSAKLVRGKPLKAYIITSDDEHQVYYYYIETAAAKW